jgi:UDP-2,3-diacylglucosamine pyrophosphatase LpxH
MDALLGRVLEEGQVRTTYVISDLHLGGDYPEPRGSGKRGFRLCTRTDAIAQFIDSLTAGCAQHGTNELVLNGDTVDFLAEQDDGLNAWSPFTREPRRAVEKLKAIVKRDQIVFDAIRRFLDRRGRVVVLLGNHDIELSLPDVRVAFRHALGVKPEHDFEFLYDGEAYVVGDALIEHGNRYDDWNQVDYDALRHVRSAQSRRLDASKEHIFVPPAGSEMVTEVINAIKLDYPFVDLLKPETAAVVPMLLALEPGFRARLGMIALLYKRTRSHGLADAVTPKFGGDIRSEQYGSRISGGDIGGYPVADQDRFGEEISAGRDSTPHALRSEQNAALIETLQTSLGSDAEQFLRNLDAEVAEADPLGQLGDEISSSETGSRLSGFAALLLGRSSQSFEKRLPALLRAMRGLQHIDTFDVSTENAKEYLNAAQALADRGGFRYVVFGHTHQAKRVSLGNGRFYFNSGTWADALQFPSDILKSEANALVALRTFVEHMKAGDFSAWTLFRPTYVQLLISDDNKISNAELLTFPEAATS